MKTFIFECADHADDSCSERLICEIRASNRSLGDSKVLFINSKDKICEIRGKLTPLKVMGTRHPVEGI